MIAAEEYEAISASDEPVAPDPTVVHAEAAAAAAPAPALGIIFPEAPPLPAGAVRGDGTAACPPDYPVKGNAQSMIYHTAESRVYEQTIPEFCFASAQEAEAAGFRKPRNS
jgi:large subunit ribosomal protein L17